MNPEFFKLLVKLKSNAISPLEQKEMQEWLSQHPEDSYWADLVEEVYQQPIYKNEFHQNLWTTLQRQIDKEAFDGVEMKFKRKLKKHTMFYWIKISSLAASVLIAVFFLFYYLQKQPTSKETQAYETKKGEKSQITLPDGSQIWLNTDTKISYDKSFGEKNREVTLLGEAFFDIKYNAGKPFVVHTQTADIKVLGTAFNVRNYSNENSLEASLIRGKIELTPLQSPKNRIILTPSQKVVLAKDPSDLDNRLAPDLPLSEKVTITRITQKDETIAETSWLVNQLVFVNQPLEKIAKEIERQFNVTIHFKTHTIKQYRYTVHLVHYNLEETMEALTTLRKFDYEFTQDTLFLK